MSFVGNAFGQERFEYFQGVRQLGMGGAGVATVNDETALLTNPAALGKLRDTILTVFDPELSASADAYSILGTAGATTMTDPQVLLNQLNQNKGKHWHAKAQVFPSFVAPNFGIGIFAKYSYDGEVDAAGTNYTFNYFNDMAAILGYSIRIWDGRIKLGVAGKFMNRVEAIQVVPASSASNKKHVIEVEL